MIQAIFENHLILSILVLLFLFIVPALIFRGRGLRDYSRPERRSQRRPGDDRRA